MNTFDDAMSTARKCFDSAAVKTGEAIELSKRYVEKAQIKSKLSSLYERLGKAHYVTEVGDKDETQLIINLMKQISQLREELHEADARYSEMKSIRCDFCGKKNAPKSMYCSQCGEKLQ